MELSVFIRAIDVFSRVVLTVYLVLTIVFKVRLPQELRWTMLLTWLILFSVARFYYYRIKHNRHD